MSAPSVATAARVAACALALLLYARPVHAQGTEDTENGRDFPKTLTLDEPGIDDEMSLPTFLRIHQAETGTQTALAFEIDKRLTDRLDLQLTGGWLDNARPGLPGSDGWQDFGLTAKYVLLNQASSETLLTLGVTRGLGSTGARRVGAETVSSTAPTFYFGQGLGATDLPQAWRPFAVTGTLGYLVPDRAREAAGIDAPQQVQIGASLQYDLHVLATDLDAAGLRAAAHLIPIVEFTYAQPTSADRGSDARQGYLAPGLIYVGNGYQLAAEALVPLTRASGTSLGLIAQLNLSFRTLGLGRLAAPLF